MITFGTYLRKRRLELGLTQEALAEKAKVSRSLIGMLEKGRNPQRGNPVTTKLDTLSSLAEALSVPAWKLEKASRGIDPDVVEPVEAGASIEQVTESICSEVNRLPVDERDRKALEDIIRVFVSRLPREPGGV